MTSAALVSKQVPYQAICDSKDEKRWLAERKKYVAASEAATVLGDNHWGSLIELWAVKTGAMPELDLSENEAVFWGHELEGSIVSGYSKRTGRCVLPFGLMLASTRFPWLSATPDALTTDDPEAAKRALLVARTIGHIKTALKKGADTSNLLHGLMSATEGWWPLQIKNIGKHSAEHWEHGVPLYYTVQCTQEALVFGTSRATGAALVTGQTLAWDDLVVDEQGLLVRQLVNLTKGFLERNVRGGIKPPPDGSDSARRTIEKLFPREKPETTLRLDGDVMTLAHERDVLKAQVSKAEKRLKEIDNQVRDAMGDAERCLFPDGSGFTLKTIDKKQFVMPASSSRTLLRKKTKGDE